MNFDPYYIDPLFLKKENEKKSIRSAANRTAVAFLLMSAVMVLWSHPYLYIGESMGLGNLFYKWANDEGLIHVFQIVVSSIAFVLPYLLLSKLFKLKLNDAIKIKRVNNRKLFLALIFVGLGICSFLNIMSSIAGTLFQNLGFSYEANIHRENPQGVFGMLLVLLSTAVTPAVVEEFAMRGVVLSCLKRYGNGFALFVSSVIFGLMHGNFEQIPFAMLLGLYLGFITIKTESILPAVFLHFLNNFFSVVTDYLFDALGHSAAQFLYPIYFLTLFVFGFIGILMLKKEKTELFKLEETESILTNKEKITAFLLSPSMIIVEAVVVLEALFVYA